MKYYFIMIGLANILLLISPVLGLNTQSHPLSQITSFDVNLNLTGVNVTNVSYVYFGNGSTDVSLYRNSSNILRTDASFIVNGSWVNITSLNVSSGLTVLSSGNVGYSKQNPTFLLDIENKSSALNVSGVLYVNGTNGTVNIGGVSPLGAVGQSAAFPSQVYVYQSNTQRPLLELQYQTGSTANMMELRSSSGTLLSYIDVTGNFVGTGGRTFLVTDTGGLDNAAAFNATTTRGDTTAYDLLFLKNGGTAAMRVQGNGMVGIGTLTPLSRLEVNQPTSSNWALNVSGKLFASATNITVNSTNLYVDMNNNRIGVNTTSPLSLLHVSGTGALLNVSNSTIPFLFVNATPQSTSSGEVLATGGVGIGTTSPQGKLDIRDGKLFFTATNFNGGNTGDLPSDAVGMIKTGAGTTGTLTIIGVAQNNQGNGLFLAGGTNDTTSGDPAVIVTGYVRSGNGLSGRTGTMGEFRVQRTGSVSLFDILANGNVGIGTTTPTTLLDVNGNVNITGTNSILSLTTNTSAITCGGTSSVGTIANLNVNSVVNLWYCNSTAWYRIGLTSS